MTARPNSVKTFEEAVAAFQQGKRQQAEDLCNAYLRQYPGDANIRRLLAAFWAESGALDKALSALREIVEKVPAFVRAWEDIAELYLKKRQFAEAVSAYEAALAADGKRSDIRVKLGQIKAFLGDGIAADAEFEAAIKAAPGREALVEAIELQREGKEAEAEQALRALLFENPDQVDALRLLGVMMSSKGKHSDAIAMLERAVALAPDYRLVRANLGKAYYEAQHYDKAAAIFRKLIELEPNARNHFNLGNVYAGEGRPEDAVPFYRKAIELDPNHAGALMGMGHVLKTLGEQDEAIEAYRRCGKLRPDFGEVFWSLANLKTFRFSDDEIASMEAQLAGGKLTPESVVSMNFALAKAYEDRKLFAKAFAAYDAGNSAKRPEVRYDPLQNEAFTSRVIENFTPDLMARFEGQGHDDPAPIFVVGLPRSGSTLVEQILASHSQIDGTAELPDLGRIAQEIGLHRADRMSYPEILHEIDPQQAADLGREYIEATRTHRGQALYFTDKLPNNFIHAGFIKLILPNAKIVNARRHPMDSCFSCFKQLFARGQTFTYDLFDLGEYYSQYMRVMDHWHTLMPGAIIDMQYEDVVDDLESEARRLIAFLGLEWEDGILDFHTTKRAVKTASSEQVRQPIYKSALAHWRNFETELADLHAQLKPVIDRLPPHIREM